MAPSSFTTEIRKHPMHHTHR